MSKAFVKETDDEADLPDEPLARLSTLARPVTQSLNAGYASRKPLTGSAPPAAPLPHAPSPRACSRSSEPAGRHARSRVVPSAAARPPPVRCEKSMPAYSIPQTWYAHQLY